MYQASSGYLWVFGLFYLGEVGDHGGQRHELLLHLLTALALRDDVLRRARVRPAPPLRRHPFDGDVWPGFSSRREVERASRRQRAEGEYGRRRRLPTSWLVLDRHRASKRRQVRQCWGSTPNPLRAGYGRRRGMPPWVLEQLLHPGVIFLLVHVCELVLIIRLLTWPASVLLEIKIKSNERIIWNQGERLYSYRRLWLWWVPLVWFIHGLDPTIWTRWLGGIDPTSGAKWMESKANPYLSISSFSSAISYASSLLSGYILFVHIYRRLERAYAGQIRPMRKYLQDLDDWICTHTHSRVPNFFLSTQLFYNLIPLLRACADRWHDMTALILEDHAYIFLLSESILWSALGLDNSLRVSQQGLSEDTVGTMTRTPYLNVLTEVCFKDVCFAQK